MNWWIRVNEWLTELQSSGTASTLTVENCDVSDAGNYTCKLAEEEATLRVSVQLISIYSELKRERASK